MTVLSRRIIGLGWLALGALILAAIGRDVLLSGRDLVRPGDLMFGTIFALAAATGCSILASTFLKPPSSWSLGRKTITVLAVLLAVAYGMACAILAAELLHVPFSLAVGAAAGLAFFGWLSLWLCWQSVRTHERAAQS